MCCLEMRRWFGCLEMFCRLYCLEMLCRVFCWRCSAGYFFKAVRLDMLSGDVPLVRLSGENSSRRSSSYMLPGGVPLAIYVV